MLATVKKDRQKAPNFFESKNLILQKINKIEAKVSQERKYIVDQVYEDSAFDSILRYERKHAPLNLP